MTNPHSTRDIQAEREQAIQVEEGECAICKSDAILCIESADGRGLDLCASCVKVAYRKLPTTQSESFPTLAEWKTKTDAAEYMAEALEELVDSYGHPIDIRRAREALAAWRAS